MDRPEHHSTDRLKDRTVGKGSGRHYTLRGAERSVFNRTNIGIVSRATLRRLLKDRAERAWAFPSATTPLSRKRNYGAVIKKEFLTCTLPEAVCLPLSESEGKLGSYVIPKYALCNGSKDES